MLKTVSRLLITFSLLFSSNLLLANQTSHTQKHNTKHHVHVVQKKHSTTHKAKHHQKTNKKQIKHRKHSVTKHPVNHAAPAQREIHISGGVTPNINAIIAHARDASTGVLVKSMTTGAILYQRNADQFFMPASTMKTVTATTALIYLGPDYRFSTRILTVKPDIHNGALFGDIYIKFDGDPSLTTRDLRQLVDSLTQQGVGKIQGNIFIDDSVFDQQYIGNGWTDDELEKCYAAPIQAIIINDNCGPVPVKAYRNRTVYANLAIRNVRVNAQNVLRNIFYKHGISITGNIAFAKAPPNSYVLVSHESAPLSQLIKQMLKHSDNHIANALYKKIAYHYYNRPASWEDGATAMKAILATKAHIDLSTARIFDGAGLSRYDRITPAQIMQVLDYNYHNNSETGEMFYQSLPIGGIDGSLHWRMGEKGMIGSVHAKTGTMKDISGLAGYVTTYNHQKIAFVTLFNAFPDSHYKYQRLEDRICTVLRSCR
jgi:D-alanyl-D-alanine carboxypeptidase/D-alanyl-D-alanine-endopeptidase (penicillin-binding protein 4)